LLKRKAKKSKALALTFDDGPGSRLTQAILNILAEYNAKATFFLLGRNVLGRERIVRQIAEQGHQIASHGYNHLHSWKVSPIHSIMDIKRGWQAINKALGKKDCVYPFRPPYGKLNLFCLLYLWIRQIPIVYWTLDSGDTRPRNKQISQRIPLLLRKNGGAVMLVHDFDRANYNVDIMVVDSVTVALSAAKKIGMRVVTISELVGNELRN